MVSDGRALLLEGTGSLDNWKFPHLDFTKVNCGQVRSFLWGFVPCCAWWIFFQKSVRKEKSLENRKTRNWRKILKAFLWESTVWSNWPQEEPAAEHEDLEKNLTPFFPCLLFLPLPSAYLLLDMIRPKRNKSGKWCLGHSTVTDFVLPHINHDVGTGNSEEKKNKTKTSPVHIGLPVKSDLRGWTILVSRWRVKWSMSCLEEVVENNFRNGSLGSECWPH